MSVAKIIEISSDSTVSFEEAIRDGLRRAGKTIKNIRRAWVADQLVEVDGNEITTFRVHLKVTFVLDE
jgi:dodecin